MQDSVLENIVFKIICGESSGSCFLINNNKVITARHCIHPHFDNELPIEVISENLDKSIDCSVIYSDEEKDIAILELTETLKLVNTFELSTNLPRTNEQWFGYGFPCRSKRAHHLKGQVLNTFNGTLEFLFKDLQLTINQAYNLPDFRGLSGSPVIVNDKIIGIIKAQANNAQHIEATSIYTIREVLHEHSEFFSKTNEYVSESQPIYITRQQFQKKFEQLIVSNNTQYLLVEGKNGVGKSTFCLNFVPVNPMIKHVSTYSLFNSTSSKSPSLLADHSLFYNCLSEQCSSVLGMNVPAIKDHKDQNDTADDLQILLNQLSLYCTTNNVIATILVDAIDELHNLSPQELTKFLTIFPINLPEKIRIIFSVNNYVAVEKSIFRLVPKQNIIELARFTDGEITQYCHAYLPNELVSMPLIEDVKNISEGNPLYLKFIIDYIKESGSADITSFPVYSTQENIYRNISHSTNLSIQEIYDSINIKSLNKVIKTNNHKLVLFNHYKIESEPYYIERTIDNKFLKNLKFNNIWIFGKSGVGKTALLHRNLIKTQTTYCYCDLSPLTITCKEDVLEDILITLEEEFSFQKDKSQRNMVYQISDLLCKVIQPQVVIAIDEISISDLKVFSEVIESFSAIINLYEKKSANNNLKFVISTINNPLDLFQNKAKSSQLFEYICCDEWSEYIEDLYKLISYALSINIPQHMPFIISHCHNSPRILKKIMSRVFINSCKTVQEIENIVQSTLKEVV